MRAVDPRSRSFVFCPYEKLVLQFQSSGLTLQETSAVWVTSLRSVFWFDPTGGVCSKVASSSISVFWFDPTRGFCIVGANPPVRSFGLTPREASAVRLLVP